MFRYDGQSGGETPGPFPNPEVKSARVSVCTVLRKRTGTQTRCQPLFIHPVSASCPDHPSILSFRSILSGYLHRSRDLLESRILARSRHTVLIRSNERNGDRGCRCQEQPDCILTEGTSLML